MRANKPRFREDRWRNVRARCNRVKYAAIARSKPKRSHDDDVRDRSKEFSSHTCHFLTTLERHFASSNDRSIERSRYRLSSLAEITVTILRLFLQNTTSFQQSKSGRWWWVRVNRIFGGSYMLSLVIFLVSPLLNRQEKSLNNRFYTALFFWEKWI